ncbi:hypothetical protein HNR60_003936 [Rhodopseudomonas rhenobacensis]|uniref:SPW repeat-containing protein n=1 Tax=Rhodopseudomonas rhenobacensis TaxID=87461 RepID=A0A7W7Z6Y5_9BRAD|nr:hypothetical protein [Rhodopseudomonas rhenobacensis]MBB5049162.1 hypothetical protein [Rhodopseudomonas rhenobacensis]
MSQLEPHVAALLWFVVAWSVCCLGFLQLAGMYPLKARAADVPVPLVIGSTVLWLALSIAALAYAITELRWSSIVIVGGLLCLFLPEAFQAIPARWRNSPAGLAVTGLVLAATLLALGGFASNSVASVLQSIG